MQMSETNQLDTITSAEQLPSIIFISGFPRSGTTWFANLFNSHPGILYRHEILGRQLDQLDDSLLQNLINRGELNNSQKQLLRKFLLSANIQTDRPPFFEKDFLKLSSPRIHQMSWLATNALPLLSPLYRFLYTCNPAKLDHVLIKETRSTVNMKSILSGLRPAHTFFLVRHPCAVIASHLSGYQSGNMEEPSKANRLKWLANNQNSKIVQEQGLDEDSVCHLKIEEFLTYRWCAHTEDYFSLHNENDASSFVLYEKLLSSPNEELSKIFSHIELKDKDKMLDFERKSRQTDSMSLIEKDSGNAFYSVFRGQDFDPLKWQKQLPNEAQSFILSKTSGIRERLGLH